MHLLIIDDDQRQRELLQEVFADDGFQVTACKDGREGLLFLGSENFDTIITDLKMPHVSGAEILKASLQKDPELPVIIITGHGTIDSAIDALKTGAHDYVQKPYDPEELFILVKKAVSHYELVKKNREMAAAIVTLQAQDLIGSSPAMLATKALIERIAPLDVSVLIQGETGTGKELVARIVHRASKRAKEKFLAINCGALNESLLDSELFGHEKGAFTGAIQQKKGLFEAASGGTLFLDEINSMSASLQVKVLRVLQENQFLRVGGTKEIFSDIRLISASNADLQNEVKEGRFRDDLYYRLHVMNIDLPPLRERKEDIPELAYYFLKKHTAHYQKDITSISSKALKALAHYFWPGNIRELENSISRAVIMEHGSSLSWGSLPEEIKNPERIPHLEDMPMMNLSEMEQFLIKKAMHSTGGNKAQASQLLGIDNSTLWRKMKKYAL